MENYFNYFTEVEECYRQCRRTPTLLSPLDWALIESWKEAGVPLEAVLIGIERAFKKYAKRPRRFQKINGLAYCSQTVLQAAEELNAVVAGIPHSKGNNEVQPALPAAEIENFLRSASAALRQAAGGARQCGQSVLQEDLDEAATAVDKIATSSPEEILGDLEGLERRLSALEDKLAAAFTRAASVDLLAHLREEIDRALQPCRRKMTGGQIESLERQFLKKRLFEHYQVPRLSLFYL